MLAFKSLSLSLMVLLSIPFALIGGVILQWRQGDAMTTTVVIGYIAVLAVVTTVFILMPIILATGSGIDVTRLIAIPSVGGMTIYVLF